MKFGPDGALYTLEWGGGFGRDNPNSGIYRVDYINGSRAPDRPRDGDARQRRACRSRSRSTPPASSDPEGGALTFAWDFDGDGDDRRHGQHGDPHLHRGGRALRAPDGHRPAGKEGTTHAADRRRQHAPAGHLRRARRRRLHRLGRRGQLGRRRHRRRGRRRPGPDHRAARARATTTTTHPTVAQSGPTGSRGHRPRRRPLRGHEGLLRARRPTTPTRARRRAGADRLRPAGAPAQAQGGRARREPPGRRRSAPISGDLEGGGGEGLVGLSAGDWAVYEPVNLTGIDSLTLPRRLDAGRRRHRAARRRARRAAARHAPRSRTRAAPTRWRDVTIDTPARDGDDGAVRRLHRQPPNFRLNFWEANGKGLSETTRPEVAITSPTDLQAARARARARSPRRRPTPRTTITYVEFFVDGEKVGDRRRRRRTRSTWTETEEDYYVVHAVATNDRGPDEHVAQGPLHRRRVRRQAAVDDVRQHDARGDVRPARHQLHGQRRRRRRLAGARTSTARCTCQAHARELRGGREGGVVRRHPHELEGGHHGPQRHRPGRPRSPGYMVFGEKGNGETEFMHDAAGNGQVNNDRRARGHRLRHRHPAELAEGAEEGQGVHRLVLARRRRPGRRSACRRRSRRPPTCRTSACSSTSHISGTLATADVQRLVADRDRRRPRPGSGRAGAGLPAAALGRVRRRGGRHRPLDHRARHARRRRRRRGRCRSPTATSTAPTRARSATWARPRPRATGRRRRRSRSTQDNEWQYAGLLLHVDDDNYSKVTFTKHQDDSRFFEFWSETGGSRHRRTATTCTVPGGDRDHGLRPPRRRRGTSCTAAYSLRRRRRGPSIGTGAPLKAGAKIGPVAAGDVDAQNTDGGVRLVPHHARPAPEDPAFDDEFDGDGARRLPLGQDPQLDGERVDVADGKLTIDDVRRRHQRREQRPDREPDPPDPARGRLDGRDEDDRAAEGQLAARRASCCTRTTTTTSSTTSWPTTRPARRRARRVELRYENGGGLTGPSAPARIWRRRPARPTRGGCG